MSAHKTFRTAVLAAAIMHLPAMAAEVTLPYRGLTLNANLELAGGKGLKDGVILVVHGTLAHGGMEMLSYLQGILKDNGINSLAINLSYNENNRHGMYECGKTHTHLDTDALGEIAAWTAWLGKQGMKEAVLLGHSRGGMQVARYSAEREDPLVKSLILMAPGPWDEASAAESYQKRFGKSQAEVLKQVQALMKEGKGKTVMKDVDFLYCAKTSASAEAVVSYHAADPMRDTPTLLPKLKKPGLLLVASADELVPDLEKKAAAAADGKKLQMKVVKGADHFFRDLYTDEAVEAIVTFLK
jgi:dienelactone hydrolase